MRQGSVRPEHAAKSKRHGDDPHVLDRGVGEEAFEVPRRAMNGTQMSTEAKPNVSSPTCGNVGPSLAWAMGATG